MKRFFCCLVIVSLCMNGLLAESDDEDTQLKSNYTVTHEAWFEIEVKDMDGPGEDYTGRFHIALFGEVAPMTVLNFVSLAKGYTIQGQKLTYKGTPVHRIVQDFVVQLGDITKGDGSGGTSIFGKEFSDEAFVLSHRSPGWVAMANHGPNTNNSQFYILLNRARWLDGKHVVFGKVIKGFDVIRALGELATSATAAPKKRTRIVDCGAEVLKQPYELKKELLDSTDD